MTVDVERTLRDELALRAGAVPPEGDPWARFVPAERRHRTRRRLRTGGLALAGVAVLGLAGTGVLPLPSWVPAITLQEVTSPLLDQDAVGSLATDQVWMDEFRRQVPVLLADTWATDSDGHWKVEGGQSVRILYAGDFQGERLALAVFPVRLGLIRVETTAWFTGPAGAQPGQMTEGASGGDLGTVVSQSWGEGPTARVLAVAPRGSVVEVTAPPHVTEAGTVERRWITMTPLPTGEYVTEAAGADARLRVRLPGSDDAVEVALGSGSGGSDEWDDWIGEMADDPQLADLSHDDRSTLLQQVPHELDRLGVSRSAATVDAVWAGPIGDDTQALLRVATDGGGVVLVASRAGPEHRDGATSTRPVVVDLTAVAPVAGVSDRPVAWRLRDEQGDETRRVGIVAPAGAARLEVTAGSQTFPATPDADGFVTVQVDPGAPAEVTAYAADGSLLGRSPIPRQADLTEGVALLGPAR